MDSVTRDLKVNDGKLPQTLEISKKIFEEHPHLILVSGGGGREIDTFLLHGIHPIIKYKLKYKQER